MSYIPEFKYFSVFQEARYPFGTHWNNDYIRQCARAIYDYFEDDFKNHTSAALVARGTSGAMVAGAILSELKHIDEDLDVFILISRKPSVRSHSGSFDGINVIDKTRLIVVDDFIDSGATIRAIISDMDCHLKEVGKKRHYKKYDMLCISNYIAESVLKKEYNPSTYRKWRNICKRFDVVVCSPNTFSSKSNSFSNIK